MKKTMRVLPIWLGLTAGNFIYQWMTLVNYEEAVERSFFQAVALLFASFVL